LLRLLRAAREFLYAAIDADRAFVWLSVMTLLNETPFTENNLLRLFYFQLGSIIAALFFLFSRILVAWGRVVYLYGFCFPASFMAICGASMFFGNIFLLCCVPSLL